MPQPYRPVHDKESRTEGKLAEFCEGVTADEAAR